MPKIKENKIVAKATLLMVVSLTDCLPIVGVRLSEIFKSQKNSYREKPFYHAVFQSLGAMRWHRVNSQDSIMFRAVNLDSQIQGSA
jgi:hypothetical protein